MKKNESKKVLISLAHLLLLIVIPFLSASCSDDDSDDNTTSNVRLAPLRAFILSEGSMKMNNSHLTYLDFKKDTIFQKDIYEAQNSMKVGDTAMGLVSDGSNLYYVVNYSRYIVCLNSEGVEKARFSFSPETEFGKKLGEPRYLTVVDDKVYVSSYGGYISCFDKQNLNFIDSVKTDSNPEQIVYNKGMLYWVCSGYGKGNTLQATAVKTFGKKVPETIKIVSNPYELQVDENSGKLFFMSYDEYYNSYLYSYDPQNKQYKKIGAATKMRVYNGKLYYANSVTPDWKHYSTTFSVYDIQNGASKEFSLVDEKGELMSKIAYFIACNPYDDSIYVGTTDYVSNGDLYHFTKDGSYITTIPLNCINPNSMVFMKKYIKE